MIKLVALKQAMVRLLRNYLLISIDTFNYYTRLIGVLDPRTYNTVRLLGANAYMCV